MSSIYIVVFWIFLRTSRCQLECVTETLDDREFSINVIGHIEAETTECIQIPYELTFPSGKVTVPYKKILFKGDPSNIVITENINNKDSNTRDSFSMDGLPQGEHEYGFKLEWGCNQTYVFPQKVWVSVSASTHKPTVQVFPMTEGRVTTLKCLPRHSCSGRPRTYWKWTKADGQSVDFDGHYDLYYHHFLRFQNQVLRFTPTADHHNTNITCVVEYIYDVVNTSVTLNVKFSPKILTESQCVVQGKLLVCVCVSLGNPLPPVMWPLENLTDYSVSSFSSAQTVHSTLTLPADKYQSTTIKCISTNEYGQAETELPLQNSRGEPKLKQNHGLKGFYEHLPWITAMCFSLNLVFIGGLIICICKRFKSKQKKHHEEINTYETLRKADLEQEYNVISSQCTRTMPTL